MFQHHHPPADITLASISGQLQTVLAELANLTGIIIAMSTTTTTLATEITALQADVAAEQGADASAITALNGLSAALQTVISQQQAAGVTPDQLAALTAFDQTLQQNTTALAAAIAANPLPATPGASGASGASGAASAHRR